MLCGRIVLLFVPPSGFVFDEAILQLVSSSGLIPHFTTPGPNMNGFSTWIFIVRSFTPIFLNIDLDHEYEREIFLITQNDPSLYCMADVIFSTFPEFGIGHLALVFVHDHTLFSTLPFGLVPP